MRYLYAQSASAVIGIIGASIVATITVSTMLAFTIPLAIGGSGYIVVECLSYRTKK